MPQLSRATPEGRSYLDLQKVAKAAGRSTQEYVQQFVLEGFLSRLAVSAHRDTFVLKGGVLLAALGSRRPTRDIDFAANDIDNDVANIRQVICDIAATEPRDADGLVFVTETATAQVIRDEDEYSGVRVNMPVTLATAHHVFHVDVNVGDPIWPEPTTVGVPRLLGGDPIELPGYPLHMVHAEKVVTAVQRGQASTRWRDFSDVWTLSRQQPVNGADLQQAIATVAAHRGAQLSPLREVLDGFPDIAQGRWFQWRRRQQLPTLPEQFTQVLDDIYDFADPAIAGTVTESNWDPATSSWSLA